jgi:lactoylglutathione lyase
VKVTHAIVFVSDMAQSVGFYRDVLGLPLGFESSHWTEFATGDATLALHLSDAAGSEASASERAGSCRPGFGVSDLDAFHRRMVEAGVSCLEEPPEVFGARIGLYADPDGLPISVGEVRG